MTRLLVSVRSAAEAEEALGGGADLIDVKEPSAGSLGAAAPHTIAEVLAQVAGRREVSAALGELREPAAADRAATLPLGVRYAKFGLSGTANSDWMPRWQAASACLPRGARAVGVVYADWASAAAPPPGDVLAAAARIGCPLVLVDTFDKSRGSLRRIWPHDALARFADDVRAAGLGLVLAGSLQLSDVGPLGRLSPDFLAVRGAVTRGGRDAALAAEQVRRWSERLAARAAAAPA